MSWDVFKTCIDKVPASVRIDFSGFCEPWQNPDCTRMLAYVGDKGHSLAVFTTGLGFPPDDLEVLKVYRGRYVMFELHVPDTEGNTRMPDRPDYPASLIALRDSGLLTRVACHGTPHPEIKRIFGNVEQQYLISRAGHLPHIPCGWTHGSIMCGFCGYALDQNVLLPDGRVVMCCMDWSMERVLGDLTVQSWDDIHSGLAYQSVIQAMKDDTIPLVCRRCERARKAE
jgi:hypothetical protein